MVKDKSTLSVINIKTMQAIIVVEQCPFKWDTFRDYTLDVSISKDRQYLEILTIEGDQRDQLNNKLKVNYSTLKKYDICIDLLKNVLP